LKAALARKQTFLAAAWSDVWKESYAKLSSDRQVARDEAALAALALIKQISSPGLRIKPIQPAKYYLEARINSGDRILFRVAEGTIFFVDVVAHDDIARYGETPEGIASFRPARHRLTPVAPLPSPPLTQAVANRLRRENWLDPRWSWFVPRSARRDPRWNWFGPRRLWREGASRVRAWGDVDVAARPGAATPSQVK
jgi:hypothetical protein